MTFRLLHVIVFTSLLLNGAALQAQDYKAPPVTISKDKVRSAEGKLCYSHFVPEKQTLYSICKAYGVTPEEVYAVNPGLEKTGIKKNSIILIPVKGKLPEGKTIDVSEMIKESIQDEDKAESKEEEKVEEVKEEEYTIHKVRWFEDIDDIALKYHIPAEYILKYNQLEGKKLKSRMKLKIPKHYEPEDAYKAKEESVENLEETEKTDVEKANPLELDLFNSKKNLDIVLSLPFNAQKNPNKDALDFYSGFLLGLKQVENAVTNIDLSVYDCAKSLPLTEKKVGESQMVFGPISSGQLEKLAGMNGGNAMIISPLDPRAAKLASLYPNFIQIPPNTEDQYKDLTRWISQDYVPGDHVITIYEKNRVTSHVEHFNSIITDAGIHNQFFSYALLEGRAIETRLANIMTAEGVNRIIINSEDEAFVNDVIRNLNILLHKKNNIIIYCPSKIRSFDTIDVENLHNLNAHVSSSYHIDYSSELTKRFVLKYRALYNHEPTQYAFQGYDLATYFIGLYTQHGKKWSKYLDITKESLLPIAFDFRKTENGSYVNHGTKRFIYEPDYQIKSER